MMKKIITLFILGLALNAKAQIPQPDPDTTARHFLTVASIGNLQEISAGEIAVQKAAKPEVKAFGNMMIMHHREAQNNLLAVAKLRRIDLPAPATGGIQPDPMLKNAGAVFDRLYVHAMVAAHHNTVQTFENYAITGKDPEVRKFAQQTLPNLKKHLAEIKVIEGNLK